MAAARTGYVALAIDMFGGGKVTSDPNERAARRGWQAFETFLAEAVGT
jgi:hypothetical protein